MNRPAGFSALTDAAPDLSEGIARVEIKHETVRFVCCAARDLIDGAAVDVQSWVMDKISVPPCGSPVTQLPPPWNGSPLRPTVTSLNPNSSGPGTSVVITGTNLADATSVMFGSVPAASFTVDSDTQITAIAPPQP
jgi:hypothetical protein